MQGLLFGLHLPDHSFPGCPEGERFERLAALAQAAEAAGFDLVTTMDHLRQVEGVGPPDAPILECHTTLGALAARTSRVRLGALVGGVTLRRPEVVAAAVAALDLVSGGRAVLGLGAAWDAAEHHEYGFDFPSMGERVAMLDGALSTCRRLLAGLRCPPPVLVGGGGERLTLRVAARHADWTHWFGTVAEVRGKREALERHCEAEARDPARIVSLAGAPVLLVEREGEARRMLERVPPAWRGTLEPARPAQAAERLWEYVRAGITGFTFENLTLPAPDRVQLAGELIRLLRSEETR